MTPKDLIALVNDIAAGSKAAVIVTITTPDGTELRRFVATSTRHNPLEMAGFVHASMWRTPFIDAAELPTQDDVDRAAYHMDEYRA